MKLNSINYEVEIFIIYDRKLQSLTFATRRKWTMVMIAHINNGSFIEAEIHKTSIPFLNNYLTVLYSWFKYLSKR